MKLPPQILLELTYNCNHRCLFCSCPWLRFPELKGTELDAAEWISVLKLLSEHGVKHIIFTGGEPLIKKDFVEILTYAAGLPFQSVSVYSNGLLMNDEMLDLFQKYHIEWATSLPGILSFDSLTGSSGTVWQLLKKVRSASRRGIPVMVSMTTVRKNQWEVSAAAMLAKFFGASSFSIGACMPEGRALEHPEFYLSDKQYKKLLSTATKLNTILGIPVRFSYEQRCGCYNEDGTPTGSVPESCPAGKEFIVISPDGYVRKCMHSPEKIDPITEYITKE